MAREGNTILYGDMGQHRDSRQIGVYYVYNGRKVN